jgi:hypothetical protein
MEFIVWNKMFLRLRKLRPFSAGFKEVEEGKTGTLQGLVVYVQAF